MKVRAVAAKVLVQVLDKKMSLPYALESQQKQYPDDKEQGLLKELCFGCCRWYFRLEFIAGQLLDKPLKAKDRDVYALLLIGLYQLIYLRKPQHAVVSETVSATRDLNKHWAKGLVNGVLRNFLRRQEQLFKLADEQEPSRYAHPQWLIDKLKRSWPDNWRQILEANNCRPPMSLRVNMRKGGRDDYVKLLEEELYRGEDAAHDSSREIQLTMYSPQGIRLQQGVSVEQLPGFSQGRVSVQDEAAQLAAQLMAIAPGQRVLDACAAPGGKAAHMLELQPRVKQLLALEMDKRRLPLIAQTLERLQLGAYSLQQGDAGRPQQWWDGQPFDAILLDVPCTASGVIRRNPDIKLLRNPNEVAKVCILQGQILQAIWPLLKPGGHLLYATCSVFPEENENQLASFVNQQNDVISVPIDAKWGHDTGNGRQIFPGENDMDGFFYAMLKKAG